MKNKDSLIKKQGFAYEKQGFAYEKIRICL